MNDLPQIQRILIVRTNLFLATHSETNCISLLSVAVISVAVVADVFSVESSPYIDTLDLLSQWHVVSKVPQCTHQQ